MKIVNRFNGELIFESDDASLKATVIAAARICKPLIGANLSCANLSGAILIGAILKDADLSGADLRDAFGAVLVRVSFIAELLAKSRNGRKRHQ